MLGRRCPPMLQLLRRTLRAASEQPTPVTLIGRPTVFRWSFLASALSTSVFDEPVSMRNGKACPCTMTRARASVSPSFALRMARGTVEVACAPPTEAFPQPVNPANTKQPTSPARAMRRRILPPSGTLEVATGAGPSVELRREEAALPAPDIRLPHVGRSSFPL